MAASLNCTNGTTQLISGNTLLVTIDVFSENVIIVTGLVGSRKYRGALLCSQSEFVKPFVQDNVFNWDYSLKNSFSSTHLSYKCNYSSDSTIIPSKLLSGIGYICENCKKKLANNHKPVTKATNNIKDESDILLLKKTLPYPELIESNKVSNSDTPVMEDKPSVKLAPLNPAPRKLKRKKLVNSNSKPVEKRTRLISEHEELSKPKIAKVDRVEEKPIKVSRSRTLAKSDSVTAKESVPCHENSRIMPQTLSRLNNITSVESNQEMEEFFNRECPKPKKIWMKMIENEDNKKTVESEDVVRFIDDLNADVVAKDSPVESIGAEVIMEFNNKDSSPDLPSIEVMNKDSSVETIDKDSILEVKDLLCPEKSVNIESSPEPVVEPARDNGVLEDHDHANIDSNAASVVTDITLPAISEIETSKPVLLSKSSSFNRSYKIKQTLHDKVILTIERPSAANHCTKVPLINDIYSFTDDDDDDEVSDGISVSLSHILQPTLPTIEPSPPVLTGLNQNNTTESKTAVKSNISRRTRASKRSCVNKIDKSLFEENMKLESKVEETEASSVLSSCENISGTLFKLDDVVWAKITGYPYWPARIMSFNSEDDTFVACIEWYAWKEVSFIKVNNLFHFKEHYRSKYQRKKRNSKYQEAVKLARVCCGMLDGLDSLASDDFGTVCSTKDSDSGDSESNEGSVTSIS